MPTSSLREEVQRALGTTYTIQRELTGGGMSRVFLAEDMALGRLIVIKVLSPDLAQGLHADRFAREIRLAARLQHPHIVPLFAAGTINGLPYYTMPYIEGESLRARLTEKRQMSTADALHILRDTARALEYAHAHDVVHRDIKPDNILISGNSACVIDFGIAKAISAARNEVTPVSGENPLTHAGFVVGTPGYMAPEQATVRGTVDHRADIYAFGCVAYELFAGKPMFAKETPQELMIAHLTEVPSAANLRRTDIPRPVADLIMKCVSKNPDERPQSATDLLRMIQADSTRFATPVNGSAAPASIAVLPFENMSGDAENEFFADGITEEIINWLTQITDLRVAGRTSSFVFKNTKLDLREIGEQLNVSMVLEGSVRKSGSRLRITAQLINVSDGYHLWSERYDRELTDVFAIQDEIATAIASRLRLSLGKNVGLIKPRTVEIDAYEQFLKGRVLMYRLGVFIFSGIECFKKAIELDPNFAMAHASLTEALLITGYTGLVPPAQIIAPAHAAAMNSVRLAPGSAESRHAMAFWMSFYGSEPEKAILEWRRAMEMGSQLSQVRCNYAIWGLCLLAHRWEDAVAVIEEGVETDPLNGFAHSMLAVVKTLAGRTEEVVPDAMRGRDLDPESFWGNWSLQRAYHAAGMHQEALRQGAVTLAMSGRHPWALCELAVTHASVGDYDAADAIYCELLARNRNEHVQAACLALAATCARKLDDAIAHCDQAIDERDAHIRWAPKNVWEGWAPLYKHPGWPAVEQRITNW